MSINRKCPKCGSTRVQLSNERSKHGCLFLIIFGIWYFCLWMIKVFIGLMIIIFYDWWMAIIYKSKQKGYIWQGKKWLSNKKRIYYCHECGYNFKA